MSSTTVKKTTTTTTKTTTEVKKSAVDTKKVATASSSATKKTVVPETILKKRKAQEKIKADRAAKLIQTKKDNKSKRRVIFKRAESYISEYRAAERNEIRLKRQAKAQGSFFVPAEPKLIFVMRIKGINKIAPKPRKILQLLRLIQVNSGVFIKMNKATHNMLLAVEPYVAYGYPNLKTVRDLIYKRGFAKVDRQRIPITNNQIIEGTLGKFGILCVEDLIHEIFTVGPNFKQASNFLWPFKLSNPTGGYPGKKTVHFIDGGECGNREQFINALVQKMN